MSLKKQVSLVLQESYLRLLRFLESSSFVGFLNKHTLRPKKKKKCAYAVPPSQVHPGPESCGDRAGCGRRFLERRSDPFKGGGS